MKDNSKLSPQVHEFENISDLKDDLVVLIVNKEGLKYKTSLSFLKDYLLKEIVEHLKTIEKKLEKSKMNRATIIKELTSNGSISLGKPLNIKSSTGIERKGRSGDIYATDKMVRIKLGNTWRTIIED